MLLGIDSNAKTVKGTKLNYMTGVLYMLPNMKTCPMASKGCLKGCLQSAGRGNMAPVKKLGIDLLILTHCHIDHRLTRREISDVPVWCHEKEEKFLQNKDLINCLTFRVHR